MNQQMAPSLLPHVYPTGGTGGGRRGLSTMIRRKSSLSGGSTSDVIDEMTDIEPRSYHT